MLAIATINNTEQTVYTVPSGKKAYVYVDVFSPNASSLTLKINNVVYYHEQSVVFVSFKLCLTSNDAVRVGSNGQVNVFIHGMEV